jgi:multidrug resistance efflux pump
MAIGLASILGISATIATAQVALSAGEISALTKPSSQRSLHFSAMGIIKSIPVIEGQTITVGQLLMSQDTDIELAELERLKLDAESTARLDYAVKDRDYKAEVVKRKTTAQGGVFSNSEIEEAKLDLERSEAQIKVVNEEQKSNALRVKQQQIKLDKMQLKSDVNGFVAMIGVREGELATPDKDRPAITVVQTDPCYVEILKLKTAQVAKLNVGDTMEVKYPGEANWRTAKVVIISPVAEGGTETQMIKLELPNPEKKATGQWVIIKLPPALSNVSTAQGR